MIGGFNKSDKHMSECIQLSNESNMSFVAHTFFKMKTRITNPMWSYSTLILCMIQKMLIENCQMLCAPFHTI